MKIPTKNKFCSKTQQNVRSTPSEIVIEITSQCNQKCGLCTSTQKSEKSLSLKTIQKVIDDAKENNVPAIRFTGGEPLLHPDIYKALAYAKNKGFYIILNTNATLVTSANIKIMAKCVDNVLVSLQGYDHLSDKEITKTAILFSKKIGNILLLKKHIPVVRTGTVITDHLIKYFPNYATLIKKIKPYSWGLFRPMGKGTADPSLADYKGLINDIMKLKKTGINVMLANALPFCIIPDQKTAASIMLGAISDDGHSRLVFDTKGFFKPSYFINKDLGKSIKTAWKHPFLKKLQKTSYLPQKCRCCSYLRCCLGGSRSVSKETFRSYFIKDPLSNN